MYIFNPEVCGLLPEGRMNGTVATASSALGTMEPRQACCHPAPDPTWNDLASSLPEYRIIIRFRHRDSSSLL